MSPSVGQTVYTLQFSTLCLPLEIHMLVKEKESADKDYEWALRGPWPGIVGHCLFIILCYESLVAYDLFIVGQVELLLVGQHWTQGHTSAMTAMLKKRLENKYETHYKIHITGSIHLCLDFEAAVVYLCGRFILDIFVGFFTLLFSIKSEKEQHIFP